MARERKSNPRKMKPLFLVLCEGETEEAYINLLKQRYRLPIRIVSKILGGSLYPKKIEQYKKEMSSKPSEIKTFFMYDGDVPEILELLKKCDGILLGSISSSVNLLSLPCLTPLYLHSKLAEVVIIGLDPAMFLKETRLIIYCTFLQDCRVKHGNDT